jgi:hypothetical protein
MPKDNEPSEVADLHIELVYSDPSIFRTVTVPTKIRLHHLHDVIQCIFPWEHFHRHSFYIQGLEYQHPNQIDDNGFGPRPKNEKIIKLSDVIDMDIGSFLYTYDFGDDWKHSIKINKIYGVQEPKEMLKLLGGSNAAPPEDSGGIHGYENFKEIISDPTHQEFENMMEWVGEDFDPKFFDEKKISLRLDSLRDHYSRYWN